jgi:hypothetical protein
MRSIRIIRPVGVLIEQCAYVLYVREYSGNTVVLGSHIMSCLQLHFFLTPYYWVGDKLSFSTGIVIRIF